MCGEATTFTSGVVSKSEHSERAHPIFLKKADKSGRILVNAWGADSSKYPPDMPNVDSPPSP